MHVLSMIEVPGKNFTGLTNFNCRHNTIDLG